MLPINVDLIPLNESTWSPWQSGDPFKCISLMLPYFFPPPTCFETSAFVFWLILVERALLMHNGFETNVHFLFFLLITVHCKIICSSISNCSYVLLIKKTNKKTKQGGVFFKCADLFFLKYQDSFLFLFVFFWVVYHQLLFPPPCKALLFVGRCQSSSLLT